MAISHIEYSIELHQVFSLHINQPTPLLWIYEEKHIATITVRRTIDTGYKCRVRYRVVSSDLYVKS